MAPASRIADLKQAGNEQFRNGQYGQAAALYARALELLEAAGTGLELEAPQGLARCPGREIRDGRPRARTLRQSPHCLSYNPFDRHRKGFTLRHRVAPCSVPAYVPKSDSIYYTCFVLEMSCLLRWGGSVLLGFRATARGGWVALFTFTFHI